MTRGLAGASSPAVAGGAGCVTRTVTTAFCSLAAASSKDGKAASARAEKVPADLQGRLLFADDATYQSIGARFARGGTVKATSLTEKFTHGDFREKHGEKALPLFAVKEGIITTATVEAKFEPTPGQTLIAIVEE